MRTWWSHRAPDTNDLAVRCHDGAALHRLSANVATRRHAPSCKHPSATFSQTLQPRVSHCNRQSVIVKVIKSMTIKNDNYDGQVNVKMLLERSTHFKTIIEDQHFCKHWLFKKLFKKQKRNPVTLMKMVMLSMFSVLLFDGKTGQTRLCVISVLCYNKHLSRLIANTSVLSYDPMTKVGTYADTSILVFSFYFGVPPSPANDCHRYQCGTG